MSGADIVFLGASFAIMAFCIGFLVGRFSVRRDVQRACRRNSDWMKTDADRVNFLRGYLEVTWV